VTVRYVAIIDVPAAGTAAFDAYEAAVLPLLTAHGGTLERRLRHRAGDGGWTEIHVIGFASADGLASYRQDPARAAAAALLQTSGAQTRLVPVDDVGP